MNTKALYKLEFHKIREMLAAYAITDIAKESILNLIPTSNPSEVKLLQQETQQALTMSLKKGRLPIGKFNEITTASKRLGVGAILNSQELLNMAKVLKASRLIKRYSKEEVDGLKYDSLIPYFDLLAIYPDIEHEIDRCILSPNEFSDEATPELSQIRKQKNRLHNQVRETIQSIIHGQRFQDMLQEAVVTMRQERYCVPIKVEYKNAFKGIIHDQSSTGATVFIEPEAVVQMNNQIRILIGKENEEINKILATLSELVAPITKELEISFKTICELDVIFAKSEFALKTNSRSPKLNQKGYVNIIEGRHPLLNPDEVVPINVYVGKDFTTLLITGPNTGGKTVTLKTVGLFTLMAQSGLQIPAKEGSELAIFDDVFAGLGDEQSIEQSLSTFSAHMKNLVEIIENMTMNSLVLLDEVGSGTDPIEGASLAMAILEYMRKQGIRTVATTHYSELKLYAISTDKVENAGCEFDVASLRPTYKLIIGIPGKSNAFSISKKLGLPEHLINNARSYLEKENVKMEDILVELEYNKKIAEIEKEKAKQFRQEAKQYKDELKKQREKLEVSKQKILQRTQEKADKMLKEAEIETEKALKEVRQAARKAQASIDEQELHGVKKNLTNTTSKQAGLISSKVGAKNQNTKALSSVKKGEEVLITTMNLKGIVIAPPNQKGDVKVQVGIVPIITNVSNLAKVKETQNNTSNKPKNTRGGTSHRVSKTMSISAEIDIRGLLVDEALPVVDKYLDDAYLSGLKQATIIHGKGTGALRSAVTSMLRKHPHIESFRAGKYGEGEMGVTVVTIKS
ncbi:MAG: hypothetical protein ATN36_08520 [Epulopiscium sp. Nele67-Bin005]|nr:MAG: hypothetical protein ATN36_08520 [Epulopiscium sp. Nele67-Bin005]